MELDRTRIAGTPFSRLCAWRVLSRRACRLHLFGLSRMLISATGPGRATQAEPQVDTGRNGGDGGARKNLYHLILDGKTQRCGAGGRAARRGMGVSLDPLLK